MATQSLDPQLLELLACPACDTHPGLSFRETSCDLVCPTCQRVYVIDEHGVPDLDLRENLVAES